MSEAFAFAKNPAGREDPVIASCRLDSGIMRPEDTFDEFWDSAAQFYELSIPDLREVRKQGCTSAAWRLDKIVLVDAKVSPHTCSRSSRRVSTCDTRFIQFMVGPGKPGARFVAGDNVYSMEGNGVYLSDFDCAHTEVCGDDDELIAYIPYSVIGYDPARHPEFIFLDENTIGGRILSSVWNSLQTRLCTVRESEATTVAAGLCGLVRGLLLHDDKDEESRETVKTARSRALRDFIEANLRKPNLGSADIMANFGISRSTLFRVFEPDGGVDRYIMSRRLERAYIDLVDHPPTRGRITQVAEAWGFNSMSHFYRVFRNEFGCAPGDVTAAMPAVREGEDTPSLNLPNWGPVFNWLQSIRNVGG